MAQFNYSADVNAPDATGYSRGYTSSKKALAGLFEDVGNLANTAVKVADQNNTQNITQKIEEGVSNTLNDFGFRTESNDSTGTPSELKDYQSQLEKVHKAYVSGALKDSNFQIRIDALSRKIRAQYPGYQAEIDTILGATLGRSTANDLRKQLMQEWDQEQSAMDASEKSYQAELTAARKDGALEIVFPGYDALVTQGKEPSKAEVRYKLAQYYGEKEKDDRAKKKLDYDRELNKARKEDTTDTAYREGARAVNQILRTSLNDTSVAQILNKIQTTGAKDWDEKSLAEVNSVYGGLKAKVRVQLMNILNQDVYADLKDEDRKAIIARTMEPLDIIEQGINDKDTGIIGYWKKMTDAQTAADVAKTLGVGADEQTAGTIGARKLRVLDGALSPEGRALAYTNSDVQGEAAKVITSIMTSDLVSGAPINEVVRNGSAGLKGNDAPAATRQVITNGVKLLTSPAESPETKANIITSMFGTGDATFFDKFSNVTNRADGRSERMQLFEKIMSPEVTKAVLEQAKSNPKLIEQYKNTMGAAFTSLFSRDIQNVVNARMYSDVMNFTYNPKTMQFEASFKPGVSPETFGNQALKMGPAGVFYTAMEQWKMSDGKQSMDKLNRYLLQLKPVMDGMGIDSNRAVLELMQANNVYSAPEGSLWTRLGKALENAQLPENTGSGRFAGKVSDTAGDIFAEPTDAKRKVLLDFIGKAEGADYNTLFGGKTMPLTKMTIAEAIDMGQYNRQVGGKDYSTAIGKYQIIEETLRRAMKGVGLTEQDLFTPENQDKLANWLIDNEGGGGKDAAKLSGIWASLPKDASGAGTYDGVGANKSTVTWDQLQAVLN